MCGSTNTLIPNKPKVVIVGLVRNCEFSILKEYSRIISACSSLEVVESFFVESDSSDNSLLILQEMRKEFQNFYYVSLGNLVSKIPHRIERIRFCRNEYVKYIREVSKLKSFDYVLVADMDGINSALTKHAINSCFLAKDWDGLFSNQLFGVSDLLALRAKNWLEEDYLIELERSRIDLRKATQSQNFIGKIRQFIRYDRTRKEIIYKRMRYVGISRKLIPVNSAFGGIGLYKTWCFLQADYQEFKPSHECEHVTFHRKLKSLGAEMYINPRFINSIFNTYNMNKIFLVRNIRMWRWNRV